MSYDNKIQDFINSNDENSIKEFYDKLYEKLISLSSKEEKLLLWEVIIIFIYYFSNNLKSYEINFGVISISENTELLKILPVIFATIIYFLTSITLQKLETTKIIDLISKERFAKKTQSEDTKIFIIKMINPFNLSNSLANLITMNENTNLIEVIFNFLLFIPLILIGLSPYYILIQMLIELHNNYYNNLTGKLCFWLSTWLSIMIVFYYISGIAHSIKQSKS
ncbi:hypothetical protein [Flavobacterium eburneipallidum]|uniref:hypothetical protein n=1 Tax=Flavobacterium eburneipallidum TaxID=3003263 RepID=UPI0022ABEABA|nr:hypothetical protein [Flavobacterium eburneipallidum]